MELNAPLLALPAIIALLFKGGIYAYAHYSRQHSVLTRLYLLFLFALSVQNLAEITHFFVWEQGVIPDFPLRLYYACSIIALAFVFHFALAVSDDRFRRGGGTATAPVYALGVILVGLVFQGDLLIRGFTPIGYSLTRVPGPLYPLFEVYALGIIAAVIGSLTYGLFRQVTPRKRARCGVVLLAIVPMAALVAVVLIFLHFGIKAFNATFTNPFAITYFLVVTAYATHRHRLFDIQFYLPGSRLRREKQAFYAGIGKLLSELPRCHNPQQALGRLADHLGCGAALVTRDGLITVGAYHGGAPPEALLPDLDRMLVTEELEDQQPDTYADLSRRRIGAIVPFCPHCKKLPAWLVLDHRFGQTVYTPQDFRITKPLFKRLGAFILDRLAETQGEGDGPQGSRSQDLKRLAEDNERLRGINAALVRERPLDSLGPLHVADAREAHHHVATIGCPAPLRQALRERYGNVTDFPSLAAFHAAGPRADLILWQADTPQDAAGVSALLDWVNQRRAETALLVLGDTAGGMLNAQRQRVKGALVERVAGTPAEEAVFRSARALLRLVEASHDLDTDECPLIGASQIYQDFMDEVDRAAAGRAPVLLRGDDRCQMVALARHLHRRAGAPGGFEILNSQLGVTPHGDPGLLARAARGTVLVDNLLTLPMGLQHILLHTLDAMGGEAPRLMACCLLPEPMRLDQVAVLPTLLARARNHLLHVPRLAERRSDLPLLCHYYTIQYNLRTGTHRWLRREEMEFKRGGWLEEATLLDLRRHTFERLDSPARRHRPPA